MRVSQTLVAIVLCGAASSASAQIVWDFDVLVTGDLPQGTDWATLTISDTATDEVTLTLDHNSTSASGQFLTEIWLNLTTIPGDMSVSFGSPVQFVVWGDDAFPQVANLWDVDIMFVTNNEGNRLVPGGSATWIMTGTGLDSTDFSTLSTQIDGVDPMFGLLQLQGIPGDLSGKLTIPEPASFAVLGLGIVALIGRRRRRLS